MRRLIVLLAVLVCGAIVSSALASNDGPRAHAADINGPAFASNSPVSFDFVALGTTSAPQTATVKNVGNAPLTFKSIIVEGRDAKDFALASNTCSGATLAPLDTCALGITFSPTKAGTRLAAIEFADNTPCHNWINLGGSGTDTPAPVVARAATCEATNTITTTTTTTAPAAPTVSANSAVTLSSKCSSRRTVSVGLKAPKGKTFKSVKLLLRGKTIKTLSGKDIQARISLRGLPRGRFTLEVRARTTDGKTYTSRHYYVTCVTDKS